MKRKIDPESISIENEPELKASPKKLLLTRSFSSKKFQIIPISDPFIRKILCESDTYLTKLKSLADSLKLNFSIEIEAFSAYIKITYQENETKNQENIEILVEHFNNLLEDIQKSIKQLFIDCNHQEFQSIQKKINQKKLVLKDEDLKFIGLESSHHKPLILNEFIINENFACSIVLFDDPKHMKLDTGDHIVINYDQSGIFLDDFMHNFSISPYVYKYFKKNRNIYKEDEIFEANLNENKVFLQIFYSKNLLDENFHIKMLRTYLKQIFERIQFNKQYVNIYYPLVYGLEKELIKMIFEELFVNSKHIPMDSEYNFLAFPTKFFLVCHEKQKDLVLEIIEKVKKNGSFQEDINCNHCWHIIQDNNNLNPNIPNNLFGLNPNLMEESTLKLPQNVTNLIEKSFILGEKKGCVLLDPKKLIMNRNNQISHLKGSRNLFNNTYNDPFNNLNKLNFKDYENNYEQITINLKNFCEDSKMTGNQKLIAFNEERFCFEYFDVFSNVFISYDDEINEVMLFYQKIKKKTLVYHIDFETMKPVEKIFFFDLEKNTLSRTQYPQSGKKLMGDGTYSLCRRKEEISSKSKKNKSSFYQKIIGKNIIITEPDIKLDAFAAEKKLKTPQLIIRSQNNPENAQSLITSLLKQKQISFTIKMKQDSKLLSETLQRICSENNLKISFINKILTIVGNRKTVNKVRGEILKLNEMDLEDALFPKEWQPQSENLLECELSQESEEFKRVLRAFNATAHNKVVRITRIQNKKLWENYCFEKKRLEYKGDATEKMLFHGTRANDPSKIYSGIEEGFDVRLANHGSVGKGIYFAENAIYSVNGYAFPTKNGNAIILYNYVLVGKSYRSVGRSYIIPPLLPNNPNLRYDSVVLQTNYTVYNSNRAYPGYLIEYTQGKHNINSFFSPPINNKLNYGFEEEQEKQENYSEEDDEDF